MTTEPKTEEQVNMTADELKQIISEGVSHMRSLRDSDGLLIAEQPKTEEQAIEALRQCVQILSTLDPAQRRRVCVHLYAWSNEPIYQHSVAVGATQPD